MKYFNVKELHVGLLRREENDCFWHAVKDNPYIIYKDYRRKAAEVRQAVDILAPSDSDLKIYYFFNDANRVADYVRGKEVLEEIYPLSFSLGDETEKVSDITLKCIYCELNIFNHLRSNPEDEYMILLKKCLNDIELMGEGKVKEYYANKLFSIVKKYNTEEKETIIGEINDIRHELDREKEIGAKKKSRKLQ